MLLIEFCCGDDITEYCAIIGYSAKVAFRPSLSFGLIDFEISFILFHVSFPPDSNDRFSTLQLRSLPTTSS